MEAKNRHLLRSAYSIVGPSKAEEDVVHKLKSLKEIIVSTAPMHKCTVQLFEQKFAHTKLSQIYGMTEIGCVTGSFYRNEQGINSDSVGKLYPACKAKFIDRNNKEITTPNTSGQLCIQTPASVKYYKSNDAATAQLYKEGNAWVYTGDIGYFDEKQCIYVVSREKDIIKYKGHQLAPSDLETTLLRHAMISDAAVVGVDAGEERGEYPFAFIVSSSSDLDETQVLEFFNNQVAYYKKLRVGHILFVEQIKRSKQGKLLRNDLRIRAHEYLKKFDSL